MLARNSDLCWLATSSFVCPRVQLSQQSRILDRDYRLVREGLQERNLVVS
jgi:hypothetical protein